MRWAITLPHLLEIGIVALGLGLLTQWNGRRLVEQMAIRIAYESTLSVQEHFQSFSATPYLLLETQAEALRLGLLDLEDTDRIRPYFWQQVQLNPAVQRLYFGDETGSFLLVQNNPEPQFHLRDPRGRSIYALNQAGEPLELLSRDAFDPRLRPWFGPALQAQQPTWSPIYVFYSQPVLGITATIPFATPSGSQGVLGVDLTLAQLSEFLQTLRIGVSGESFIMDRNGDLVASSSEIEPPFLRTPGGQERLRADQSADPLIKAAARYLSQQWGSLATIQDAQQGSLEVDSQRIYLQWASLQDPYGLDWLLVVLLPEADFIEPIWAIHRQTALITLLVLGVGITGATMLYRQLHQSFSRLVDMTHQAQQGNLSLQRPAAPFPELDQLADAIFEMTLRLGTVVASQPSVIPALGVPEGSQQDESENTPLEQQDLSINHETVNQESLFLHSQSLGVNLVDPQSLGLNSEQEQYRAGQFIHACTFDEVSNTWITLLNCPIVVEGEVLGILRVSRPSLSVFADAEIHLLQRVATLCGLAIYQARLYQVSQTQITELERLNQLKADFVSTVSQELRSPLSNVHMALGMLARTERPEKREQYLSLAIQECERQIHFINDLLDIQRLASKRPALNPRKIALCPFVEQVMAGIRAQAQNKEQLLEVVIAPTIAEDPAFDQCPLDGEALARILRELAFNAVKYTAPQGRLRLEISFFQEGLRFVMGNSASIDAAELPRIFDKFYRIPQSDRWNHGGTGLGLALVKELAIRMGGYTKAESQEGWTQVWVWLPLLG
ncbi:MAG: GAF domain-containing protein [Synechococcaceae cyanobacterium SM2_3_2]|nr:GAF domain-containing protein [Synechococcaceae cyanobacterium SM2_3_2]